MPAAAGVPSVRPGRVGRRWNSWPGRSSGRCRPCWRHIFLHTGRWRQPPAPAAGVRETWLAALRRVYVGEAVVQRGCADLAARMEDGCLRQLLAAEADRAAERGKRLANLLEKALTTENNLLKW